MAHNPSEQFDFKKYGLVFIPTDEDLETYQREFKDLSITVEVWNHKGIITILELSHFGRFTIAHKYYCKTKEQVDFLFYNGSVARLFDSEYFVVNERSKIL